MNFAKDSFVRSNVGFILLFFVGVFIIILQVSRSYARMGLECEKVHNSTRADIVQKLSDDESYCLEEYAPTIRQIERVVNNTWCPFEHVNVGHDSTRNSSRVHICMPSSPPGMTLKIVCPPNSTAYYWDTPMTPIYRTCNNESVWEDHTGHCGCHYDIFKWDRVAYYFASFQKFKVLLVIFSATSLVVATYILVRLNSLHCTRNTIHLHLFVACLLYNATDLVVFFTAISIADVDRVKFKEITIRENPADKYLCRGKDTMTIYSILAIYSWVLIEGVYLHSLVLTAFYNGRGITKMKYFAPFGWLLPLAITMAWITANKYYRDSKAVCWDTNLIDPSIRWIGWIYDVPKKLLLLVATILFFSILKILWSKISSSDKMTSFNAANYDKNEVTRNASKYAQIVRASIILLVVYGIWDLKELFMHQDEFKPESVGWWIVMLIDILIDSMRGFFIASVYCFSNTEVRQEIARLYRRRCINNDLRKQRTSRRSSVLRRASSLSQCRILIRNGQRNSGFAENSTRNNSIDGYAANIPVTTGSMPRQNSADEVEYLRLCGT